MIKFPLRQFDLHANFAHEFQLWRLRQGRIPLKKMAAGAVVRLQYETSDTAANIHVVQVMKQ